MKKIYIVLSYTGTVLAKIVKFYTKNEYSHVSISLDRKLDRMYSFGRLNPYNPFIGGFVHEGIDHGTFKRFKKTKCIVLSLDVTKRQYESLENIISKINVQRSNYRFNTLGLIGVMFKKRLNRNKCFYCAEFVKYVLEQSNINNNLPSIIKPQDFKEISNIDYIYSGLLKNYQKV